MNSLLVSDLHLTDNPRDKYRWQLFEWLANAIPEHSVKYLFVLGDLTDAKDYHSARLVNRIVSAFLNLYRNSGLITTYILKGNHDGTDPACPYFAFLGQYPSIKYISMPVSFDLGNRELLMLPHTRDPVKDWQDLTVATMHTAELLFMHATVRGAIAENGMALDGIPPSLLLPARRADIYSGDIHTPQTVGPVTYVGAPYPVRFGDSFEPRAILLESRGKGRSLPIPAIRRKFLTVTPSKGLVDGLQALSMGDQVKVRFRLAPAEYVDWQRYKRNAMEACAKFNIELCGVELERVAVNRPVLKGAKPVTKTSDAVWQQFCTDNKLDKRTVQVGQEILKGTQ